MNRRERLSAVKKPDQVSQPDELRVTSQTEGAVSADQEARAKAALGVAAEEMPTVPVSAPTVDNEISPENHLPKEKLIGDLQTIEAVVNDHHEQTSVRYQAMEQERQSLRAAIARLAEKVGVFTTSETKLARQQAKLAKMQKALSGLRERIHTSQDPTEQNALFSTLWDLEHMNDTDMLDVMGAIQRDVYARTTAPENIKLRRTQEKKGSDLAPMTLTRNELVRDTEVKPLSEVETAVALEKVETSIKDIEASLEGLDPVQDEARYTVLQDALKNQNELRATLSGESETIPMVAGEPKAKVGYVPASELREPRIDLDQVDRAELETIKNTPAAEIGVVHPEEIETERIAPEVETAEELNNREKPTVPQQRELVEAEYEATEDMSAEPMIDKGMTDLEELEEVEEQPAQVDFTFNQPQAVVKDQVKEFTAGDDELEGDTVEQEAVQVDVELEDDDPLAEMYQASDEVLQRIMDFSHNAQDTRIFHDIREYVNDMRGSKVGVRYDQGRQAFIVGLEIPGQRRLRQACDTIISRSKTPLAFARLDRAVPEPGNILQDRRFSINQADFDGSSSPDLHAGEDELIFAADADDEDLELYGDATDGNEDSSLHEMDRDNPPPSAYLDTAQQLNALGHKGAVRYDVTQKAYVFGESIEGSKELNNISSVMISEVDNELEFNELRQLIPAACESIESQEFTITNSQSEMATEAAA